MFGGIQAPELLDCIRQTIDKVVKLTNVDEVVQWVKGDCSVFEDGFVKVDHPHSVNGDVSVCSRKPEFEATEYCHQLHVLRDPRMKLARTQLVRTQMREQTRHDTL